MKRSYCGVVGDRKSIEEVKRLLRRVKWFEENYPRETWEGETDA